MQQPKSKNIFSDFFLDDEKIFFVRSFLNDLDCVSRVPENYLGHSTVISERDIDRVYGGKPGKSVQIAPESPKHPTSSGADYAFIQSQNAS